ncbi:MAG: hypothetical protein EPN51_11350 [Mycobacterium sp.]|nr:MAG: hypothetical protein EPN51_11350 [Mycobacterium sp.]
MAHSVSRALRPHRRRRNRAGLGAGGRGLASKVRSSRIPRPASHVPHPTSRLPRPASPPVSRLPRRASRLAPPASRGQDYGYRKHISKSLVSLSFEG